MEVKHISSIADAGTNKIHPVLCIDKIRIIENMYGVIIELKHDITSDKLQRLRDIIENAFVNRAGKVENISKEPYRFEFVGDEREYGCLHLGIFALEKEEEFLKCVSSWQWIDEEEPDESCDILEEISVPVR